jgi:hypothetical protein
MFKKSTPDQVKIIPTLDDMIRASEDIENISGQIGDSTEDKIPLAMTELWDRINTDLLGIEKLIFGLDKLWEITDRGIPPSQAFAIIWRAYEIAETKLIVED